MAVMLWRIQRKAWDERAAAVPMRHAGDAMARPAEQRRAAIAASDERCVYLGVQWVRGHYNLHHAQATSAIREATKIVGPVKAAKLLRDAQRADLTAGLQDAEGKWPGVLATLLVEPHRRVAERYAVDRGSIWWVLCRLRELSALTGQTIEATVRAVLRDLRRTPA